MEEPNIKGMDLVTQHIVMSKDLNSHGNLFGGIMLAWIDEAAALYAMEKIAYTNIVTVNMDDVNFKYPGKNGDIIQIHAAIEKTGKSSLTVRTIALSINEKSRIRNEVINCRVTFVCLDASGKPFPYFEMFGN
ncbi:MAG TPA: hotdog domain-containing protein [Leptospiraceae bacterium]|nr:hotdog domain-containing protein [Leptospiraceae bacterium]HMW04697.1 hotdog domain-containing protein [Leptospiraceae bacterium]HMX31728.1 hotdog domain-containing protein [Leptospiraceae bacterium]HMY30534.1 hotdog domain-containing protein [Leptospiraceae bacterium]HMZ64165.1 hotdog domain-containing protein [Leptospiraceae bacterium]